jgi:hypothetical protein
MTILREFDKNEGAKHCLQRKTRYFKGGTTTPSLRAPACETAFRERAKQSSQQVKYVIYAQYPAL